MDNELALPSDKKTQDELAARLGVSRQTLYNWRQSEWWEQAESAARVGIDQFPLAHTGGQLRFLQGLIDGEDATISEKLRAFKEFKAIIAETGYADIDREMDETPDKIEEMLRRQIPDEEIQALLEELMMDTTVGESQESGGPRKEGTKGKAA